MGSLIVQSLGGDPTDFASRKPRVSDKTGFTGEYDFVLEFVCDGCRGFGANLPMVGGGGTMWIRSRRRIEIRVRRAERTREEWALAGGKLRLQVFDEQHAVAAFVVNQIVH
jgi:hypothetical protein